MNPDELKQLAAQANGETWKYLEKDSLSADDKVQVLACAYASLYLWTAAGGMTLHLARAHWLLSRVCCVLGEASLAVTHVELCEAYTSRSADRKDFEEMYAVEARARVCALTGERDRAMRLKKQAEELCARIKNAEDKKFGEADLRSEPWFGI